MYPYMGQQSIVNQRAASGTTAMAVRSTPGYMSFPSYLRASMNGNPGFRVDSSQPSLRLRIPYDRMALQQRTQSPVYVTPHQLHLSYCVPHQPSQAFSATDQNTSMYFDEAICHLEHQSASSKGSISTPMFPQAMPAEFRFRPLEPSQHVASVPTLVSSKIDDLPEVPWPSVITNDVDLSKYEPVSTGACMLAPIEYESSSPASVDTPASALRTPDTPNGHCFVDWWNSQQHSVPQAHSAHTSFNDGNISGWATASSSASTTTTLGYSFLDQGNTSSSFDSSVELCRFNSVAQSSITDRTTASPQSIEGSTSSPSVQESDTGPSLSPSSTEPDALPQRTLVGRQQRDEYLLEMRAQRYSFKDIKRLGRFTVAESTLRGRFRVLTKHKNDRVRKPRWKAGDVKLLRAAVDHFSDDDNLSSRLRVGRHKLPWKKISEWMRENRSSYLFAPSTCAKKWDEISTR